MHRLWRSGAAVFGLCLLAGPADAAGCMLNKIAELPVQMLGRRPLVAAKINDQDVLFEADSGASVSTLNEARAEAFKLKMSPAPGVTLRGVGGASETFFATVPKLTLAGQDIPLVDFFVTRAIGGPRVVGALGQNVLGLADVEYDLPGHMIRLMKPDSCGGAALAYWAAGQGYGEVDIAGMDREHADTVGVAYVNGVKLRVIFDTGAYTSVLTEAAAARAGVKVTDPDVTELGATHGVGPRLARTWTAPFASFKIGGEEIKNTRLRISDFTLDHADMLIGVDFFLSHHIYVANSQHKLYFTYVGGPVFDPASKSLVQDGKDAEPHAAPPRGGGQGAP